MRLSSSLSTTLSGGLAGDLLEGGWSAKSSASPLSSSSPFRPVLMGGGRVDELLADGTCPRDGLHSPKIDRGDTEQNHGVSRQAALGRVALTLVCRKLVCRARSGCVHSKRCGGVGGGARGSHICCCGELAP